MAQEKQAPSGNGGDERLKRELSGLPKITAPWYFESELQRRLGAIRGERPRWVQRPAPAIAFSIIGIAVLGVAGYFLYPGILSMSSDNSPVQIKEQPLEPVSSPETRPSEGNAAQAPSSITPRTSRDRTGEIRPREVNEAGQPMNDLQPAHRAPVIREQAAGTADSASRQVPSIGRTNQPPPGDSEKGPDTSHPVKDSLRVRRDTVSAAVPRPPIRP